jgi:hypothetical protein
VGSFQFLQVLSFFLKKNFLIDVFNAFFVFFFLTLLFVQRGTPKPSDDMLASCIPCLWRLIYHSDSEVLTDACWALCYVAEGLNKKAAGLTLFEALPRLIAILDSLDMAPISPVLRTIVYIIKAGKEHLKILHEQLFFPKLNRLLTVQRKSVKKDVCWSVLILLLLFLLL